MIFEEIGVRLFQFITRFARSVKNTGNIIKDNKLNKHFSENQIETELKRFGHIKVENYDVVSSENINTDLEDNTPVNQNKEPDQKDNNQDENNSMDNNMSAKEGGGNEQIDTTNSIYGISFGIIDEELESQKISDVNNDKEGMHRDVNEKGNLPSTNIESTSKNANLSTSNSNLSYETSENNNINLDLEVDEMETGGIDDTAIHASNTLISLPLLSILGLNF